MGRTQRFFRFRTLENLHKSRLFRVERSTKRFRFRVSPVMTTSIPLHIKCIYAIDAFYCGMGDYTIELLNLQAFFIFNLLIQIGAH